MSPQRGLAAARLSYDCYTYRVFLEEVVCKDELILFLVSDTGG
ncbi:MAG: hypothetical protein Kow0063_44860 [Anaerolineae bacterium]